MVLHVSAGITKKKNSTIVYPNIPSALRPVPHGEGISVPEPPKEFTIVSDDEDEGESTSGSPEPPASTEPHISHGRSSAPQPHILTQDELNDLVRDLELSKSKELNSGIFSRKMSEFLRFVVVISSWCLYSKRKLTLCSATM
jgi:hypothetical protein